MSNDNLSATVPTNALYIIDGVASALVTSILCRGKSIHCIFEVKKTPWREVELIEMYEMLLHDVHLLTTQIIHVEGLHYIGKDFKPLKKRLYKFKYFLDVRQRLEIPPKVVLLSTSNSVVLRAHRFFREYILIDEGMSSLITRNGIEKSSFAGRLQRSIFKFLKKINFDKEQNRSNITLTADEHIGVRSRLSVRNFQSDSLRQRYFNMQEMTAEKEKSILVLLAGPPHLSSQPIVWHDQLTEAYLQFNLGEILKFLRLHPEFKTYNIFLKTHPTLGVKNDLISTLPQLLDRESITAFSIYDSSNDIFQSSIPAEAFLSVGDFSALLSLDISSTVYNVCHEDSIRAFMPLDSIMRFQRCHGDYRQQSLYEHQIKLNKICGEKVIFF